MRHSAFPRVRDLADDEAVYEFLNGDEIDSDHAFKMLVERHGPMVLGVCRQVLDHEADAEDAFQLTFLILARKVASVRNPAMVGAWLHEVAYRTALRMRGRIIRRRSLERQSVSMWPSEFVADRQHHDAAWNELRPVLHDEVRRLPDKYRIPIILSYLEGKTNEEVAAILNWPVGTVKGRLSRARTLLQSRLVRRGVTLSAAFLVTALADGAVFAEVVPPELIKRTVRFVRRFKAQAASSALADEFGEPDTGAQFGDQHQATFDTLQKLPKFTLGSLVLLVSLLSISALIGLGVACGAGGALSYFRPRATAPQPTPTAEARANIHTGAIGAACH